MDATKTALVTGGTSGLGEAAAVALARAGWRVLVVGRDPARGAEVVAKLKSAGGDGEFLPADLFSVAGVKALAQTVREKSPSLDLLVNNAGGTFGSRSVTANGLERTFALNVAAPFVLTDSLIEPLAAARGRVVNIVTGVPDGATATLDQLAGPGASAGMGAYVKSKLALGALTREQQRRYGARGITAVSLHPGIIPGTGFGQDMPAALRSVMGWFARVVGLASTLEQAADRYVQVGTGAVEAGGFYKEGKLTPAPRQAQDPAFGTALWARLETVASA